MNRRIAPLGLILIALFLQSCKFGKHTLPIISPHTIEGQDTAFKTLPQFEFTNQDGKTVTQEDFLGKVFIADFFFVSCPTICPVMSKNISKIYERYEGDTRFKILSHSIDTTDSIPVLKAYAKGLGVSAPTWHFVTGARQDIYDIGYDFYMATIKEDSTEGSGGYLHSGDLILIDRKGRIRGIYDGTSDAETGMLISDLRILLKPREVEE